MQSGHIPWKLKRHICTDFRSCRVEAGKKEMVSELSLPKLEGHLDRLESGPWNKMDLKDSYNGLVNWTLCRCFGPRVAMYLDRYV
jgi:hypothetical protein